jgi:hypothetical protein
MEHPINNLVLILGDQLDEAASVLASLDPQRDVVWMAEVMEESTHVWCSKQRAVLFLSAMRHFAQTLRDRGLSVSYRQIDDPDNRQSLAAELGVAIETYKPNQVVMTAPGDWGSWYRSGRRVRLVVYPCRFMRMHISSRPWPTSEPMQRGASNFAWSIGTASLGSGMVC